MSGAASTRVRFRCIVSSSLFIVWLSISFLSFLAYLLRFYIGDGWHSILPSKRLGSFQTFFQKHLLTRYSYRQHWEQHKAPVFNLLICRRGRFWGFFASHGRHDKGIGPPKLKFLLRFDQNVEYKRPAWSYPLRDFHKISRIWTSFQDALAVKISLDLLKGLWGYGGLKLTGLVIHKFSAPKRRNYASDTTKVLEVQERARGPLSPCQVCWSSDFTRRRGGQKRLAFCLFVCLFDRHAFERQRLCARFRHEGVAVQKQFWCRWIE